MTQAITAALLAAGILGLLFNSTRGTAIAAIAALTFIYPAMVFVVLAGAGLGIYIKHFRT